MRLKVITLVAAAAALGALAVIPATAKKGGAEQFKAKLKGDLEVPERGDPNGSGRAEVKIKRQRRKICHKLFYRRIEEPTAAHIHRGEKGEAGRVVITLEDEAFQSGSGGCQLRGVKRRLLRRIENNPTNYYINLHNAEYPDGAIRGQLTQRP